MNQGVVMRRINFLTFIKQNGFGQEAIVSDGREEPDTILTCEPQDRLCVFRTKLHKDFFTSDGNVTGTGEAVLEFEDISSDDELPRTFLRHRRAANGDLRFAGTWPLKIQFEVEESVDETAEWYTGLNSTMRSVIIGGVIMGLLTCGITLVCCCFMFYKRGRDKTRHANGTVPREVDVDSQASFFKTFHKDIESTQSVESPLGLSETDEFFSDDWDDWDGPSEFYGELPDVPEEDEQSNDGPPRSINVKSNRSMHVKSNRSINVQSIPSETAANKRRSTGKPETKKGKNKKGKNAKGKNKKGKAKENLKANAKKKKNELPVNEDGDRESVGNSAIGSTEDLADGDGNRPADVPPNTTILLASIDEDIKLDENSVQSTESPIMPNLTSYCEESFTTVDGNVSFLSESPAMSIHDDDEISIDVSLLSETPATSIRDFDDEIPPDAPQKIWASLRSVAETITLESTENSTSGSSDSDGGVSFYSLPTNDSIGEKSKKISPTVIASQIKVVEWPDDDELPTDMPTKIKSSQLNVVDWPSDDEVSVPFSTSRIKIEDWQSDDDETLDISKQILASGSDGGSINTRDTEGNDSVNFYPRAFDVAFGNPDHDGTMIFEMAVRRAATTNCGAPFRTKTFVDIGKELKGRSYYLKEKAGSIEFWREATSDEVEELFEKSYRAQLVETEQIRKLTNS
jgi:hypothetical protein